MALTPKNRDIHNRAFDEGTLTKLALFQDYVREWLPVFIVARKIYWPNINIFDFFAGPGSDLKGNDGSPIIVLRELKHYADQIKSKSLNVNLFFNEYDSEKAGLLKEKMSVATRENPSVSIHVTSNDFKDAFDYAIKVIRTPKSCNLLFLDQGGIKQVDEIVFERLLKLDRTDFLFFISSSTIKRFAEHPFIKQYIKMDTAQIERTPFHEIHRLVLDYYRSLIPKNKDFYLGSFSLKKKSNLYGLIFGSGHVLGIEKFLKACWKIDQLRGEANFDIDDDRIQLDAPELFERKPKKVELFERELSEKIIERKLTTDRAIYKYTLLNGFIPVVHARTVFQKLILENKVKDAPLNLTHKVCDSNAKLTVVEVR